MKSRKARLADYHENRDGRAIRCAALCKTVVSASSPDLRKNCACSATFFLDFRLHRRFHPHRDFNMRTPRAFFRAILSIRRSAISNAMRKMCSRGNMHIMILFKRDRKAKNRHFLYWHTFLIVSRQYVQYNVRMTHQDRAAPVLLKVTDSCNPTLYNGCSAIIGSQLWYKRLFYTFFFLPSFIYPW